MFEQKDNLTIEQRKQNLKERMQSLSDKLGVPIDTNWIDNDKSMEDVAQASLGFMLIYGASPEKFAGFMAGVAFGFSMVKYG